MVQHDNSYKLLFSDPEMIRDLLTGFVREEWVSQLDFNSLEKVSGSYVSDDLRDREDDIIWRVRWGGEWLYVYLLLEFQSSIDRFMAVRIMAYEALLYQDLIRQKAFTANGKLPPVLPIVLYNGEKRWTAAQNVADLVEAVPGGLSRYCPQLNYLLLDEGSVYDDAAWPEATRNLVTALFQLEHSQDEQQWIDVIAHLGEWLKAPEHATLRRAFTIWIRRVMLPSRLPGLDPSVIGALQDLHEVHDMLAERIKQWPEKWKREGLEQGIEQGIEQGALQTARRMIEQTTMNDKVIAELVGLEATEIRALRAELKL